MCSQNKLIFYFARAIKYQQYKGVYSLSLKLLKRPKNACATQEYLFNEKNSYIGLGIF